MLHTVQNMRLLSGVSLLPSLGGQLGGPLPFSPQQGRPAVGILHQGNSQLHPHGSKGQSLRTYLFFSLDFLYGWCSLAFIGQCTGCKDNPETKKKTSEIFTTTTVCIVCAVFFNRQIAK